jgi:hypothetical protein
MEAFFILFRANLRLKSALIGAFCFKPRERTPSLCANVGQKQEKQTISPQNKSEFRGTNRSEP